MDLSTLLSCAFDSGCLVTQLVGGLLSGMQLFMIACGITLIFGVLGVLNFAHGSLFMLGAYFAYAAYGASGNFLLALLAGSLGAGALGVVLERLFISRVYGPDILRQILVCYALVLIFDDLVKIGWGASFVSMGMPETFRVAPLFIAGGVVPAYYLLTIAVSALAGWGLWLLIERTRFGKIVRAVASNRDMAAALGIRVDLVYAAVFGLGCLLAGLAGALAAPARSLTSGMGFSVLMESFVVTVIGGMGSIPGAFVVSIGLGVMKSLGALGFPQFVDGTLYAAMAVTLLLRPTGLFGQRGGR